MRGLDNFKMETEKELKKIKEEILDCKECSLSKTRNLPVIGEGNHEAQIIFVGEGPGAQEDKTGRPFCGAAGKILDELLDSVGIKREEVYICNILKCRPPANRDPQKEEIEACVPFLERQIEIIKPEVICPLGRFAMEFLMDKFGLKDQVQGISKIHGEVFEPQIVTEDAQSSLFEQKRKSIKEVKIIPLYHPAVVAYNSNMREILKKDFKILEKFK